MVAARVWVSGNFVCSIHCELFCFFWMKGIATCYCHFSFLFKLFVKAFANFRKWQLAVLFSARATGPCGLCCLCFYLRTSERGYIKGVCTSEKMQKCFSCFAWFLICPYDLTTLVFLAFPVLTGELWRLVHVGSFEMPLKSRLCGTLSEMSLRQIASTSSRFSIL